MDICTFPSGTQKIKLIATDMEFEYTTRSGKTLTKKIHTHANQDLVFKDIHTTINLRLFAISSDYVYDVVYGDAIQAVSYPDLLDLELSKENIRHLLLGNITSVDDLTKTTAQRLLSIPGINPKQVAEIEDCLMADGLKLRYSPRYYGIVATRDLSPYVRAEQDKDSPISQTAEQTKILKPFDKKNSAFFLRARHGHPDRSECSLCRVSFSRLQASRVGEYLVPTPRSGRGIEMYLNLDEAKAAIRKRAKFGDYEIAQVTQITPDAIHCEKSIITVLNGKVELNLISDPYKRFFVVVL